jgi:secondary thiamine-phosphate synthase enzyme
MAYPVYPDRASKIGEHRPGEDGAAKATRRAVIRRSFVVETAHRVTAVDVTAEIGAVVRAAALGVGVALIATRHTTCGVRVTNAHLVDELQRTILALIEGGRPFWHDDARFSDCERGNARAHMATAVLGTSVVVPVGAPGLALGADESVVLLEFDGPRRRTIDVTTLGIG